MQHWSNRVDWSNVIVAMFGARCGMDRTAGAFCLIQSPSFKSNIEVVEVFYRLTSNDVMLQFTLSAVGDANNSVTYNASRTQDFIIMQNLNISSTDVTLSMRAWRFLSTRTDYEEAVVESVVLFDSYQQATAGMFMLEVFFIAFYITVVTCFVFNSTVSNEFRLYMSIKYPFAYILTLITYITFWRNDSSERRGPTNIASDLSYTVSPAENVSCSFNEDSCGYKAGPCWRTMGTGMQQSGMACHRTVYPIEFAYHFTWSSAYIIKCIIYFIYYEILQY